jgi:hypothetical protein
VANIVKVRRFNGPLGQPRYGGALLLNVDAVCSVEFPTPTWQIYMVRVGETTHQVDESDARVILAAMGYEI